MSTEFFKKSDCDVADYEGYGDKGAISWERANALLRQRGTVVYGAHGPKGDASDIAEWDIGGVYCDNFKHTHRALLINIEPLEKDSAEKVLRDLIKWEDLITAPRHLLERARKVLGEA